MYDASSPANQIRDPGSAGGSQASGKVAISFSEIISALSFAIDLTEDAIPGHALRSCVLGMRIGRAIGMSARELEPLYYALLLKDVGCSSNAARICQIVGGDDRIMKRGVRLEDWTRPHRPTREALSLLWRHVLPGASLARRLGRILRLGATQHQNNREVILLRCERGAAITRKLGLSPAISDAVFALDEHWDGSGYPLHLRGEAIPLLARILAIAEHLDAFACERNPATALRVLRERSSRWFDPELVRIAIALDGAGQLWAQCLPNDDQDVTRQLVLDLDPEASSGVGAEEIDRICEAFADVVDAKSPFTYRHSVGVARVAVSVAAALKLPAERLQVVHRAALLHDLGKLSVPNTILDKSGRLTPGEWRAVMEHPQLTRQILARIEPFAEIAEIAGAHHEKLDGSGYPNKLRENQLSIESRVIAVADIYRAMTEGRPYRIGMSHAAAIRKLRELTPHKLDAECVEALNLCCDPARGLEPPALPAGGLLPGEETPVRIGGVGQPTVA